MSSTNLTSETDQEGSASFSSTVLERVSESAILRSGGQLSVYSHRLVSTNGKYSLIFGLGFFRVQVIY